MPRGPEFPADSPGNPTRKPRGRAGRGSGSINFRVRSSHGPSTKTPVSCTCNWHASGRLSSGGALGSPVRAPSHLPVEPQSLAEPHATPPPAPGLSPAQPHWHHHPPAVGSCHIAALRLQGRFVLLSLSFNFVAARFTGDFVQFVFKAPLGGGLFQVRLRHKRWQPTGPLAF